MSAVKNSTRTRSARARGAAISNLTPDTSMWKGHLPARSPKQVEARRELMRDLIAAGVSRSMVFRTIQSRLVPLPTDNPDEIERKREFAEKIGGVEYLDPAVIVNEYGDIRNKLREEFEADGPTARAATSARIEQDLLRIRKDVNDPKLPRRLKAQMWHTVIRHESLLADVQGAKVPIQHKVDLSFDARQTLIAVVMGLSEDEQDAIVVQQEALALEKGE